MAYKKNKYDLSGEHGIGYDINGNTFSFDLEDYERIKCYYWYKHKLGYIKGWVDGKHTMLHRFIMNCPDDKEIDHINHNRVNCLKENMRICTRQQNQYNQPMQKSNTSGYKGIDFHKSSGKYRARIRVHGKRINLGYYNSPTEAHAEYCRASLLFHGEFGCVG